MSIRMKAGASRLTVLGSGWSSTAIESGDGFTEDGGLIGDVAGDLGYDFGDDVDWDLIGEDADIDWEDIVYTDDDGTIYTDDDGDGVWTDEFGNEYPGGGTMWLPEDQLLGLVDTLDNAAAEDADLMKYSIPKEVLPSLYGGKVSVETNPSQSGSDRPHTYSPAVWCFQKGSNGILFLDEPFYHGTASGGSIDVYDQAITIRDGSSKAVYWSSCTTRLSPELPSPYSSYPEAYVCWQCLYGSFSDALISKSDKTISKDAISGGTSGLSSMTHGGRQFFAVSMKM